MDSSLFYKFRSLTTLALIGSFFLLGCEKEPRVLARTDATTIEDRYGLTGAYSDRVPAGTGTLDATIVPITLSDGRTAQLIIPKSESTGHRVFLKEGEQLRPVVLQDPGVSREEFVRSKPKIVRAPAPVATEPENKRSMKEEVLIVAGSAGAGAAIGAVAGGKKGAAIGAISGGVAGLIYDLATRKK
jgi:hypothetical protein